MASMTCTLDRVRLTTVQYGQKYQGRTNSEGMELGDDMPLVASDEPDKRQYLCLNCGEMFDGAESFDLVKAHLGSAVEKDSRPVLAPPHWTEKP